MIAVGRYDRIPPRTTSRPARRGRGRVPGRGRPPGPRASRQLLLEHLAQAGRERGIDRFVAEVLPDNRRMIQTFRDAGYQVVGGFEDGVMQLEFPIDADRHRRSA